MTTISTQAASLAQAERLKKMQMQMATLQQQLTTQKKTNLFKGLGVDASPSARYRASLDEINTYSQNIDIADRRIKLMSQGLTSFKQQAGNISSALTVQLQRGEYEMDSVADLARKTEESLRDILNLQDGDRFLFGGSETLTRPITDTGTDEESTSIRMEKHNFRNAISNSFTASDSASDDEDDTAAATFVVSSLSSSL